jgi:hypothetical protein
VPTNSGAKLVTLSLEPQANGFLLTQSETGTSMTISENDILALAQSLPALRDLALARRSPRGDFVSAVVMTPVTRIGLNTDIHKTEIQLLMFDRHGARVGFALAPDVARPLAERLPVRLAEIDAASKNRVRQ